MKEIDELRAYVHEHRMMNWSDNEPFFDCETSPSRLADLADAIEAAVGERYAELPRDADGEVVHVGDLMETKDGETFEVSSLDYGHHPSIHDGMGWMAWSENAEFDELAYTLHHSKKPTLRDKLYDLVLYCVTLSGYKTDMEGRNWPVLGCDEGALDDWLSDHDGEVVLGDDAR